MVLRKSFEALVRQVIGSAVCLYFCAHYSLKLPDTSQAAALATNPAVTAGPWKTIAYSCEARWFEAIGFPILSTIPQAQTKPSLTKRSSRAGCGARLGRPPISLLTHKIEKEFLICA